jgi:stage II sporulation protein AA (anti-sigma F factor antagonist)
VKLADVRFSTRDAALLATVSGEIDMSNAQQLAAGVTGATANELAGVVLDLTAVDYIDSAGIHLMYGLRESLRTRGQELKLVVPAGSPVAETLRLAGILQNLHVVEALDDALRGFAAPDPDGAAAP